MTGVEALAELGFLIDEVQLEHQTKRRAECARQVYLHAFAGADLGPYVARLQQVASTDYMTMRHIGWALAVHAYRTGDGALVQALLAGPHRLATLQLDHRGPVGPAPIAALLDHATAAQGGDRQLALIALARRGEHGADLAPLIPLLLESLGAKPSGRGGKRVDLDAMARGMLGTLLRRGGPAGAALRAELTRRAAGTGAAAQAAAAVLAAVG
jgi:hypothetical protein